MKYIFVLLFIAVFICFDKSIGYTGTSALWTHATYMFQHATIIHLILNSIAFIAIFRILEQSINKWLLSAAVFSIGFAASFLSAYEIPTVGASGVIYAMTGIFFAMVLCKKFIIKDMKAFLTLCAGIIISLIGSYLMQNSNFWLHVFCLIFGFCLWLILLRIEKLLIGRII